MNGDAIKDIDETVDRVKSSTVSKFFDGKINKEEVADLLDRLRVIRHALYGGLIDLNALDEELRGIT